MPEGPKKSWLQSVGLTMSEEEKERARSEAALYEEQAQRNVHDRIERDLANATGGWARPAVIRTFDSNDAGETMFAWEASVFQEHGYQPAMQSAEGSHLHAGRLILTGGLSVFAGRSGTRSQGKLTVTFQKQTGAVPVDAADQLKKLGELRDAGVVTEAEFEAKKAELLARM